MIGAYTGQECHSQNDDTSVAGDGMLDLWNTRCACKYGNQPRFLHKKNGGTGFVAY